VLRDSRGVVAIGERTPNFKTLHGNAEVAEYVVSDVLKSASAEASLRAKRSNPDFAEH
jgi:hypothetical protein